MKKRIVAAALLATVLVVLSHVLQSPTNIQPDQPATTAAQEQQAPRRPVLTSRAAPGLDPEIIVLPPATEAVSNSSAHRKTMATGVAVRQMDGVDGFTIFPVGR